jgi:dienelactone hydrolase
MTERRDVEFEAEGAVTLRGWLFLPDGPGPRPAITMAHGYAGVKEHGLELFARAFADDGFVVLAHDHRSFGASDGEPRRDVDPWRQIADWRRAISFLESRPEVDPQRIGLWGTSYAGGHAIVLGATDRRLRCVVAQVPTISGYEQGLRRTAPDAVAALEDAFAEDERAQARGEPPHYQAVVSADPAVAAAYRAPDAIAFYRQPIPAGIWENTVTVRSTRAARMYEPGIWIGRVSPTPLLMVVGLNDTITLADLALAAYERALEPKRLEPIPGGHFDPYLSSFTQASGAARAWFREHLTQSVPITPRPDPQQPRGPSCRI